MARTGRPSKLKQETIDEIVRRLTLGESINSAVEGLCDRSTFFAWMKRGCNEDAGVYAEFYQAIQNARAKRFDIHMQKLRDKFGTNWLAAK